MGSIWSVHRPGASVVATVCYQERKSVKSREECALLVGGGGGGGGGSPPHFFPSYLCCPSPPSPQPPLLLLPALVSFLMPPCPPLFLSSLFLLSPSPPWSLSSGLFHHVPPPLLFLHPNPPFTDIVLIPPPPPPPLIVSQEEDQDPLILGLYQLQDILNSAPSLSTLDITTFITPFCSIVQSDDTTGPVTGMAIASLEKFIAYNLIGRCGLIITGRKNYYLETCGNNYGLKHDTGMCFLYYFVMVECDVRLLQAFTT